MTTSENIEELCLDCSDDELTKAGEMDGDIWCPDPAELENLYKTIETNGTLGLEWKCHGRRLPSPLTTREDNPQQAQYRDTTPEKSNDFDFKDEMSSLRLRVRREGEDTLRGSAKKKTSSFDGIVSNIMRHKRIEQMEREAENP